MSFISATILDVVKQIANTNPEFKAYFENWSWDKNVLLLFTLADLGFPVRNMAFLTPKQLARFRVVAQDLAPARARELLAVLRQPGKAWPDKEFVPRLLAEAGVSGKAVALLARKIQDTARELLLADPSLLEQPVQLMQQVRALVT